LRADHARFPISRRFVIAIAVNAAVFSKLGFGVWSIPMLITTLLLALEATPDPS
jgi:hypothetical protein